VEFPETTPSIESKSPPRRLKVAVYAIAKNEEQHVRRFMSSVEAADVVAVADSSSTDATVAALQSAGAAVHETHISLWRFDDARNAALALVPADVDVCEPRSLQAVGVVSPEPAIVGVEVVGNLLRVHVEGKVPEFAQDAAKSDSQNIQRTKCSRTTASGIRPARTGFINPSRCVFEDDR
jgi:hypothetical protein